MRWAALFAVAVAVLAVIVGILPMTDVDPGAAVRQVEPVTISTIVVAAPDGPYRRLAEEIAAGEPDVELASDWREAIFRAPDYLLWVISPEELSDAVMVEAGLRLRDAGMRTAAGILTGSSLQSARALYRRAGRASGRRAVALRGQYEPNGIEAPRLRWIEGGGRLPPPGGTTSDPWAWRPASREAVWEVLPEADYLAYSGHGAAGSWHLAPDPDGALGGEHVPRLRSTVVTAAACQTLRPWVPGSIAMAFVDHGAAGYAGFAYSPMAGYLLGPYDDVPLRHTWSGFTTGQVVRLQNLATLKGFAKFPQYWLLGDPRMALRGSRPYRAGRPVGSAGKLRLRLADAPPGWLPVRVPGGGGYDHVRVRHAGGEVVGWQREPLYNAELQAADRDGDKLVLVRTSGGEVTIELARRPPAPWVLGDLVVDSLDHTLIYLPRGGGDVLALLAGFGVVAGILVRRRRHAAQTRGGSDGSGFGEGQGGSSGTPGVGRSVAAPELAIAVGVGVGFAAFHALWTLARLEEVSIVSKPLWASPVAWIATGVLVTAGTWLALTARSRRGRALAVLVAAFPAWAPTVFALAIYLGSEVLFRTRIPTSPYSAVMALPPALATLIWAGAFLLVTVALRRRAPW